MEGGEYSHATFIDKYTNLPVYVHRKGSNVIHGYYYTDANEQGLLSHYGGKQWIDVEQLKKEYKRISALSPEEATKNSPLKVESFQGEGLPQNYYNLNRFSSTETPDASKVKEILSSLDSQNRWLVKHAMISNPYVGDGKKEKLTNQYASTFVGDETDTSPFRDTSDQEYISTREYLRNMNLLINYIDSEEKAKAVN